MVLDERVLRGFLGVFAVGANAVGDGVEILMVALDERIDGKSHENHLLVKGSFAHNTTEGGER